MEDVVRIGLPLGECVGLQHRQSWLRFPPNTDEEVHSCWALYVLVHINTESYYANIKSLPSQKGENSVFEYFRILREGSEVFESPHMMYGKNATLRGYRQKTAYMIWRSHAQCAAIWFTNPNCSLGLGFRDGLMLWCWSEGQKCQVT